MLRDTIPRNTRDYSTRYYSARIVVAPIDAVIAAEHGIYRMNEHVLPEGIVPEPANLYDAAFSHNIHLVWSSRSYKFLPASGGSNSDG